MATSTIQKVKPVAVGMSVRDSTGYATVEDSLRCLYNNVNPKLNTEEITIVSAFIPNSTSNINHYGFVYKPAANVLFGAIFGPIGFPNYKFRIDATTINYTTI